MTKQGVVSQPPGMEPGAVAQSPVRAVSTPPHAAGDRTERIGSAWQERSDDPLRVATTLRGVQERDAEPELEARSAARRGPRLGSASEWEGSGRDREERLSDIPTQMRDPTTFESRRPARSGFPWRYVGVLALTGAAYFAWLYLLDHM
jgi:hypothetical protein